MAGRLIGHQNFDPNKTYQSVVGSKARSLLCRNKPK